MKHVRNILSIMALSFVICYLCGSFIAGTFVLSDIDIDIRRGIVAGFVIFSILGAFIYGMVQDLK